MDLDNALILMNTFAMRLHTGPPLSEPEFCLYHTMCHQVETIFKIAQKGLDQQLEEME